MPRSPKKSENLIVVLRDLQASVDKLQRSNTPLTDFRLNMALSFLRGVASVLGAIMAVAILVPFFLWLLRGIEWPPLIGSWISVVIEQVEQAQQQATGYRD